MSKKVVYQITRRKINMVEVENLEQEEEIRRLNREFERVEKANKTYQARCVSLDELQDKIGYEMIDETISVEEQIINEEYQNIQKKQIHNAMKKLTERQQEMVRMVFYENKTQDEVAKFYGITKQAVSNAMVRIYAAMRKNLEKK